MPSRICNCLVVILFSFLFGQNGYSQNQWTSIREKLKKELDRFFVIPKDESSISFFSLTKTDGIPNSIKEKMDLTIRRKAASEFYVFYERFLEDADKPAVEVEICSTEDNLIKAQRIRGEGLPRPLVSLQGVLKPKFFEQSVLFDYEFFFGLVSIEGKLVKLQSLIGKDAIQSLSKPVKQPEIAKYIVDKNCEVVLHYNRNDSEIKIVKITLKTSHKGNVTTSSFFDFKFSDENTLVSFTEEFSFKSNHSNDVTSISKRSIKETSTIEDVVIEFKKINVEDGMEIDVPTEPVIPFEYHNGKIIKVVDQQSIRTIDELNSNAKSVELVDPDANNENNRIAYSDRKLGASEGLCGLYCLVGACEILEKPVVLDSLFSSEFITRGGSSADDLINAGKSLGLNCEFVTRVDLAYLTSSKLPALLFINSRVPNQIGHWILYIGTDDNQAEIYDPTVGKIELDFGSLAAIWHGDAVFVSGDTNQTNIETGSLISNIWNRAFICLWVLLSVALINLFFFLFKSNGFVAYLKAPAFLLVSIVLGILFFQSRVEGFANNKEAVMYVLANNSRPIEAKLVSSMKLPEVVSEKSAILVDARLKRDFQHSRIANAINLPITFGITDVSSFLGQVDKSDRIIVYCQSQDCDWDSLIAARLVSCGFEDVSVLDVGYAEASVSFPHLIHKPDFVPR